MINLLLGSLKGLLHLCVTVSNDSNTIWLNLVWTIAYSQNGNVKIRNFIQQIKSDKV